MWAPPPIREVSTQPAQSEVGGYKRRCTSSQYPERSPVRHFSQGSQIVSDARTNDMRSESCRGPCSGVPLRPQPAPFYILLAQLGRESSRRARNPLHRVHSLPCLVASLSPALLEGLDQM